MFIFNVDVLTLSYLAQWMLFQKTTKPAEKADKFSSWEDGKGILRFCLLTAEKNVIGFHFYDFHSSGEKFIFKIKTPLSSQLN